MIRIQIINADPQHFMVFVDEPFRGEISLVESGHGVIVFHGYRGTEIDLEQEPTIAFVGDDTDNRDATV